MDEATLPWFGDLYYALSEYKDEYVLRDVLYSWMKNAKEAMERLAPYGEIEARLWRTAFRRDYIDDSFLYYHVDGKYDLSLPDRIMHERECKATKPLSRAERIELLVNRCMLLTKHVDYTYDYHPYNDIYVEQHL